MPTSADVVYLDTSALVKLLVEEADTAALRRSLRSFGRRVSSALLKVELLRTVKRAGVPRLLVTARRQLAHINLIATDDDLLERAAAIEPATLRSLDAIHLASAMSLGAELGALMTYDDRMGAAATALGLPVLTPR